jgi:hypothetical protein
MSEVHDDCQSTIGEYHETPNLIIKYKRDKNFQKISDVHNKLHWSKHGHQKYIDQRLWVSTRENLTDASDNLEQRALGIIITSVHQIDPTNILLMSKNGVCLL